MEIKKFKLKKIGILTGGGDCPGLNAVIRAIAKSCIIEHQARVIGFEDGFEGVIHNRYHELSYEQVSGILTLGGTILGTSNTSSPFDGPMHPQSPIHSTPKLKKTLSHIAHQHLDVLFCIGGDGTLSIAECLSRLEVPIIGIPKTIDNDLNGTDVTFGFNTAVQIATDAIDRLHSTAMAHHRVMIVEVMGRYAGWLALYAGIAGGGDIILIPEIPYDINAICTRVMQRNKKGKRFSLIIIAEGSKPAGGSLTIQQRVKASPDPVRLGGVSQLLAHQIEQHTHLEARVTILGHLQRGGTPTAYDRLLATKFGIESVHLAEQKKFGRMVALVGSEITSIALAEAVSTLKVVPVNHPLLAYGRAVGTSFGQ